jgi:type I restriction enzyme S subunit
LLLLAGTTTIPDLNHGEFLATPFVVPSINEQEKIVSFLESETPKIDSLIAKVRGGIDRLNEFRTALISAAVTGKIDAREVAA